MPSGSGKIAEDEDDDTRALFVADSADVHFENITITGSGSGTAVKFRNTDQARFNGTVSGFEKGIVAEDANVDLHHASITDSAFGLEARSGSAVTVVDTRFQRNSIADIIYDEDSTVTIYDVVASDILQHAHGRFRRRDPRQLVTSPNSFFGDPELYQICYAILEVDDQGQKSEHGKELAEKLREKWEQAVEAAETIEDIRTVADVLKWLLPILFMLERAV